MAKRVVAEFGNLHAPGQTFPSFLVQGTDVPLTALAVTRLQWHKASLAILAASTGSTWFYERQMRRNLTICTIFFFFFAGDDSFGRACSVSEGLWVAHLDERQWFVGSLRQNS